MTQTVLNRYEATPNGDIVIDVAAAKVEDLYNDYDKCSPYIRRDLDRELVDYLIDCAKEIRPKRFVIRFTLAHFPDQTKQARVCRSIDSYFLYLGEVERHKGLQMLRKSAALLLIGLIILSLSISLHQALGDARTVMESVVAEGLTIAAWVALWEALAALVLEWLPQQRNLSLFKGLAGAKVVFRSEQAGGVEHLG
jgi:hypothetical protein